jgi:hypothetical protein
MHKQAKETKSSREMSSSSAEISTSTSADPDSGPDNQQRPSPSVGDSGSDRPHRPKQKKSKTPEEIREKASSKRLLRNREAAVEHVLAKPSSRRGIVRGNDSEGQLNDITMVLKEDGTRKEKIPGAVSLVGSSKDELKKDAALVNLASVDGAKILSSMENGQLLVHAGAGPNVVDGEPVPLPPELTLQRPINAFASSAGPGAFSVGHQERHRFRDLLFRRTTSRHTTSRQNMGVLLESRQSPRRKRSPPTMKVQPFRRPRHAW